MKRANGVRSLEELWELEERHPLVNPSDGGLARWMYATRMLSPGPTNKRRVSPFKKGSRSRKRAFRSRR